MCVADSFICHPRTFDLLFHTLKPRPNIFDHAGAEDILSDSGAFEIITPPEALDAVRQAIEDKGITMASAEITMRPQNTVHLTDEKEANSMLRMYELLEDIDDVQKVYANFDIEESLLEKIA